jgi:hypothetical protein
MDDRKSALRRRRLAGMRVPLPALKALGFAGAIAGGLFAGSASADPAAGFPAWSDNPFAFTLSDDLFAKTDEFRFEKATRVFGETMSGIGDELADIATFPVRNPWTFGAAALGIGALVLVDVPLTTAYQKTLVPIGEKLALPRLSNSPWLSWMGTDGQYMVGAVAGTYAFGILANDERAQVAAMLSGKALAYSYLTSHIVLKAGFGRMRPEPDLANFTVPTGDYSTNPFDFFKGNAINFRSVTRGTAMPSFHFTAYFSMARVYSGVYDNYLVPYALAGALALQSAEGHNHWVSDMVAGALIGTGIGNVVLHNYEDRKRGGLQGTFVPIVSSRGVGGRIDFSF